MDIESFKQRYNFDTSPFFDYLIGNSEAASILLLDEQGVIVDLNKGMTKIFGYQREDLEGKYFSLLFTDGDRKKGLPEIELNTVLSKGSSIDINYMLHKDGSKLWSTGESIFVKNKDKRSFIVKIIFEINKQKLLENRLKESNKSLELANRDLENFVYTASHDLKAPINNLEGLLKMLSKTTPEDGDEFKLLRMMKTSIERFKLKLEDLTTVGKFQQASQGDASPVSFENVLEEVIWDLQDDINTAKAHILRSFRVASVAISKKNLHSILYNLLSNAIKYRSPKRDLRINIATEQVEDDTILLTVSDNGLGLSKEDHAQVFEMYKRFHKHVEGTGVGMALVKRIVENNGGDIQLESELGKGSTFKVYFKSYLNSTSF